MGKLDDMRREREARLAAAAGEAPAEPDEPDPDATRGRCAVCGKALDLDRGRIKAHQKGLGKPCPGSRQPPA